MLRIRVQPGARQTEIVGPYGDSLKIRIAARPEQGEANAELIRFLSDTLQLPRAHLTITSGVTNRNKKVRIEGLGDAQAIERVGSVLQRQSNG